MKVIIEENSQAIWLRDAETLEGMASESYMKDGTQHKIIAVLEDALLQAKGQAGLTEYVN